MNLRLDNVSKTYDKEILHQISLSVQGIHALGIIGESGCGKSTLLRILAGIEGCDSGTIEINGQAVRVGDKDYQSQIGYVFQKHNLFPHLTLLENITLILTKRKKIPRGEAVLQAQEMLKRLHLEAEMGKKPSKVSGGQAQRASIARALSTKPSLLFLDEPTAALDPLLTKEVLYAIEELKGSGKDFIFATHELAFLEDFADYILYIKDGRIVEHGPVEILECPRTKELAKFLLM